MKPLGDAGFDWTRALPEQAPTEPLPQCQFCLTEDSAQYPKAKPVICEGCLRLKLGIA